MRVTYCTYAPIAVSDAPGALIRDCQVTKTTGSANFPNRAFGIFANGAGATVQDCAVGDITTLNGTTNAFRISLNGASGAFALRNRIAKAGYGVIGGKYKDNVTSGVTMPFQGGTDAGGNN